MYRFTFEVPGNETQRAVFEFDPSTQTNCSAKLVVNGRTTMWLDRNLLSALATAVRKWTGAE